MLQARKIGQWLQISSKANTHLTWYVHMWKAMFGNEMEALKGPACIDRGVFESVERISHHPSSGSVKKVLCSSSTSSWPTGYNICEIMHTLKDVGCFLPITPSACTIDRRRWASHYHISFVLHESKPIFDMDSPHRLLHAHTRKPMFDGSAYIDFCMHTIVGLSRALPTRIYFWLHAIVNWHQEWHVQHSEPL